MIALALALQAAPACAAGDLRTAAAVRGGPAAPRVTLRVRNRGAGACTLDGLPDIRILGADRRPLPLAWRQPFLPGQGHGPVVPPVTIAPGHGAGLTLRLSPAPAGGRRCVGSAVVEARWLFDTMRTPLPGRLCFARDGTTRFDQSWLATD